jgi:hypothetical protein
MNPHKITVQCPMCLAPISKAVDEIRDKEVSCRICDTSFAVSVSESSGRWARFKAAMGPRKSRVA